MNSQNPIGHHIICLEQVDSTNSFLMREKQYLKEHGLVVTANSQLGGRGRSGRRYISVPGKNLTFFRRHSSSFPQGENRCLFNIGGYCRNTRVVSLRQHPSPAQMAQRRP